MQACYLIIIPSGYDIILTVSLQIHSMCDVDPVLCKTHQEGIKVSAQEKKKAHQIYASTENRDLYF